MSRRRSTSIPGLRPTWAAWLALLAMAVPASARAEGPKPAPAVLHLVDGGYVEGELRDSEKAGVLRWQARPFVGPFAFNVKAVNRIQWPPPEKIERPVGDYCFELASGDVVFGALGQLDDRRAELVVPRLGHIQIDRANLLRIYRWRDGADLIYLGPNGLVGWHEPAGQKNWREESGQPTTDREGSSIRGDFGLPAKAVVEFEISWKSKPDFVLALGVDDRDASVKRAFRFEAWGGDLVVQRELEQEADLSVVQEVKNGPGRAHLQANLDQEKGRILVFSPGGTQLADLQVGAGKAPAMKGLYLANIRGDVRLEWLRIGRWNGEIPREVRVDQARIHRADGSITYGTLIGYRTEAKAFVVKTEKGEQAIAAADVSSVFLSPSKPQPARMVRAVYLDGSRLSGDLERVDSGAVVLKVPGVDGTTRLPIAGLRSLVGVAREGKEPTGDPLPRLETDGVRLIGQHENGVETPSATCLVWHPAGSSTASPLKRGVSGRIFYREPPAARPSPNQANAQRQLQIQMMALGRANAGQPAPPQMFAEAMASKGEEPRSLYLRSGDVVMANITRIDEKGVHFQSSMTTTTFVPHEKVKAVELAPLTSLTVRLGMTKADRLLTLPRMQKANPPTHLIRSRNGDYLRVRLVGMDEKNLRVETRLEEKELPRDRVAEIIWLHPEELKPVAKPAADNAPTRVQAVRRDGIRVTFTPTKFADGTLFGTSDVLGDTHIRIAEIDQLPIGEAIREAAAQLKYGKWALHNASEPIEPVNDSPGGGGAGTTGTESTLVGKPAPDFDLALLDGKRFRLSGSKGKIVVLDFWATWCGPCIRAMPEVEKVAAEFDENNVQLVAVNLQESPEQIKAMMGRHGLKAPRVALDRDGSIAEKYQAHAIPQTVVIGRDGNVARLFVGGGPHLADQLRDAIKGALGGKP